MCVVELIYNVFNRALCFFGDVLNVPDLVLQRFAVGFHFRSWSSCDRFTYAFRQIWSAVVQISLHIIDFCIESNVNTAVLSNQTAVLSRLNCCFSLSLTHLACFHLAFKVSRVQLCNDVSFVVFKLALEIFHLFISTETPGVFFLEITSKACRNKKTRYLIVFSRTLGEGFKHALGHIAFELRDIFNGVTKCIILARVHLRIT